MLLVSALREPSGLCCMLLCCSHMLIALQMQHGYSAQLAESCSTFFRFDACTKLGVFFLYNIFSKLESQEKTV